jgi:hypothetical protein
MVQLKNGLRDGVEVKHVVQLLNESYQRAEDIVIRET